MRTSVSVLAILLMVLMAVPRLGAQSHAAPQSALDEFTLLLDKGGSLGRQLPGSAELKVARYDVDLASVDGTGTTVPPPAAESEPEA